MHSQQRHHPCFHGFHLLSEAICSSGAKAAVSTHLPPAPLELRGSFVTTAGSQLPHSDFPPSQSSQPGAPLCMPWGATTPVWLTPAASKTQPHRSSQPLSQILSLPIWIVSSSTNTQSLVVKQDTAVTLCRVSVREIWTKVFCLFCFCFVLLFFSFFQNYY